jgi:hypothetical protein
VSVWIGPLSFTVRLKVVNKRVRALDYSANAATVCSRPEAIGYPFIPLTHASVGNHVGSSVEDRMKHEMSYRRRILAALCMLGLWSPNWLPRDHDPSI